MSTRAKLMPKAFNPEPSRKPTPYELMSENLGRWVEIHYAPEEVLTWRQKCSRIHAAAYTRGLSANVQRGATPHTVYARFTEKVSAKPEIEDYPPITEADRNFYNAYLDERAAEHREQEFFEREQADA